MLYMAIACAYSCQQLDGIGEFGEYCITVVVSPVIHKCKTIINVN